MPRLRLSIDGQARQVQGVRRAAEAIRRVPLGSLKLVGYGSRSLASARTLVLIFPLFVAVALAFIADIDSPRHGMIRVHPQNLISLAASLRVS
jgi:hypothetical protein